jgi:hypothetical protein
MQKIRASPWVEPRRRSIAVEIEISRLIGAHQAGIDEKLRCNAKAGTSPRRFAASASMRSGHVEFTADATADRI